MAKRELARIIDSEPAFRELVRGYLWNARMTNGALFQFWTSDSELTRHEARMRLVSIANGDYEGVYESRDITDIWRSKG